MLYFAFVYHQSCAYCGTFNLSYYYNRSHLSSKYQHIICSNLFHTGWLQRRCILEVRQAVLRYGAEFRTLTRLEDSGFDYRQRQDIFIFSKNSHGLRGLMIPLINGYGIYFPGRKRTGHEINQFSPSNAVILKECKKQE